MIEQSPADQASPSHAAWLSMPVNVSSVFSQDKSAVDAGLACGSSSDIIQPIGRPWATDGVEVEARWWTPGGRRRSDGSCQTVIGGTRCTKK